MDKKYKGNYNEFEAKWMEIISLLGEKIIIGSIYRHLKPNVHSFSNYLKTASQKLEKKKKIILTGNFNRNIYIKK